MADTFTQAFIQAFNSANKQEEAQRIQMQQMMQMMQMKQMADAMIGQKQMRDMLMQKGETIPGQEVTANITQQGGYRDAGAGTPDVIARAKTPDTVKPTPAQESWMSNFVNGPAALNAVQAGMPFSMVEKMYPQVGQANNIEAMIVRAEQGGNPQAAERLINLYRRLKGAEQKPVNMPAWYDSMGVEKFGQNYHTPEGQRAFANWIADPQNAKTISEYRRQYAADTSAPMIPWAATDPNTGQPIGWDIRRGTPQAAPPPKAGEKPPEMGSKNMSEDLKQDITALKQAEDLLGSLRTMWTKLDIGNSRLSPVQTAAQGYLGFNPEAKIYMDMKEAFLGNISRSVAAERGVLTNQDIDRIKVILAGVSLNPLSSDTKQEADLKWQEIDGIMRNAEKRAHERRRMTYQNPEGAAGMGGYPTGNAPTPNAPNSNYPPMKNTLPKGAKTGKYNGEPAYTTDGKTFYHALTNKRLN